MKTNDIRGIVEMIADKRRVTTVRNYRPSMMRNLQLKWQEDLRRNQRTPNNSEPPKTLCFKSCSWKHHRTEKLTNKFLPSGLVSFDRQTTLRLLLMTTEHSHCYCRWLLFTDHSKPNNQTWHHPGLKIKDFSIECWKRQNQNNQNIHSKRWLISSLTNENSK